MLKMPTYQNNSGRIYLSGGMQHAVDLGVGWRSEVADKLMQLGFFPLDIAALDVAYSTAHGHLYRTLSAHDSTELLRRKSNIRSHFVDADVSLVRNHTDAVVVLYDESARRGAGTISEVHEAYMAGIPIFLVNGFDDISEVPGWMQAETTRIFPTFAELFQYMGALPPGIIVKDRYGNRRSGMFYLCSLCGEVEEKHDAYFVSTVHPLYCKRCVEIVRTTREQYADRSEFFHQILDIGR